MKTGTLTKGSFNYKTALDYLQSLNSADLSKLSAKEKEKIKKLAVLVEEHEDKRHRQLIPRNEKWLKGNDIHKISELLGYTPDLISLIEFKMYQKRINQKELSALLNVSVSKLSQILNKKREPDFTFLKAIHEKLGIDGNIIFEAA